jgi:hypothetical protein
LRTVRTPRQTGLPLSRNPGFRRSRRAADQTTTQNGKPLRRSIAHDAANRAWEASRTMKQSIRTKWAPAGAFTSALRPRRKMALPGTTGRRTRGEPSPT